MTKTLGRISEIKAPMVLLGAVRYLLAGLLPKSEVPRGMGLLESWAYAGNMRIF